MQPPPPPYAWPPAAYAHATWNAPVDAEAIASCAGRAVFAGVIAVIVGSLLTLAAVALFVVGSSLRFGGGPDVPAGYVAALAELLLGVSVLVIGALYLRAAGAMRGARGPAQGMRLVGAAMLVQALVGCAFLGLVALGVVLAALHGRG